jgi:hypothetical protein
MCSELGLAGVIHLSSPLDVHEDGEQSLRHAGALSVLFPAER